MTVSEIFERWQKPSHIQLHAGEMTAQELRSVIAVVRAVQAEVTAALSDQVVVPKEPTQILNNTISMINGMGFDDAMKLNLIEVVTISYEAGYRAGKATPASTSGGVG